MGFSGASDSPGKGVIVTPDRTEVVREGDILIVSGSDDKLEQFLHEAKKNEKERKDEKEQ